MKQKDLAMLGNLMNGLQVSGLLTLGLKSCWMMLHESSHCLGGGTSLNLAYRPTRGSGSELHTVAWIEISNRKISETFSVIWYNDGILPLQQIFCSKTLTQKLAGKVASFAFQQHHHVQPWLMCLRQVMFFFKMFPQMRNLGATIELDPQGDKVACPAFGLSSSPAEYSTLGLVLLGLTSLTNQPTTKSSDGLVTQRRHVSFAMSERERAIQIQPLECPTTRKEPLEEGRDQPNENEDLAPLVLPRPSRPPQVAQRHKKRRPSVWQDPTATLEQEVKEFA